MLFVHGIVDAQTRKKQRKTSTPDPETVLIEAKDGVEIRAEWFGGTKEKESVPIIMIHDWDSNRKKLTSFARLLQKEKGYAIIVPDLRGHGESITAKGLDDELDRKRFKKNELASMVEDIDSCRRFLQEKNDAGELNLDMLTVIACGKMSVHAVNWCITDWSWGTLPNGVKQGQNVKSLVLVSPRRKFKSLSMVKALKAPLFSSKTGALPVAILYGERHTESNKDGQAIFEQLKKSRKEQEDFSWEDQSLFKLSDPDSNLAGEAMINKFPDDLGGFIAEMIDKKILANKDDLPWQVRKAIKD